MLFPHQGGTIFLLFSILKCYAIFFIYHFKVIQMRFDYVLILQTGQHVFAYYSQIDLVILIIEIVSERIPS